MASRPEDDIAITEGSGNVFADLDIAEPEEQLAKAQLASHIRAIIESQRLTQTEASRLTNLDQPKISALINGRLAGFSSDRLMRCLTALGHDVHIVITPKPRGEQRGQVRIASKAA